MDDLISRQATIDAMNEVYCHIEMIKKRPVNKTKQAVYLDMIGAVKSVPYVQPDLSEYSDNLWRNAYERGKRDARSDFDMTEKIDKAYDDGYEQGYLQGKADYERKTGKWIKGANHGLGVYTLTCDKCGYVDVSSNVINYCPNCGAKMEGE